MYKSMKRPLLVLALVAAILLAGLGLWMIESRLAARHGGCLVPSPRLLASVQAGEATENGAHDPFDGLGLELGCG
ncbi:hypothetical protein [Tsukamurella sp. 1534]|uniref:hypothetical protein n=1 Tax=Tsukamurella sp. 1534 TaxID=1151061 RepID=UPI0002FB7BA0|nr:hypothetical protein [Tsukamurella sp. 1534]